MPRRKKIEEKKEEPRRRGRPRKTEQVVKVITKTSATKAEKPKVKPVVAKAREEKKTEKPASAEKKAVAVAEEHITKPLPVSQSMPKPSKIVLRHFTEEEIKREGQKKRIMWVGISVVIVFIAGFWSANLKSIANRGAAESPFTGLTELRQELSTGIKDLSPQIKELKEVVATSSAPVATSTEAGTSTEAEKNTNIDEINQRLKELIINSSSTINNKE